MKRTGFTFVEVTAAIAVLVVCGILFAQLVALSASERAKERTRQLAVDQVQNIMERIGAERFDWEGFDKEAAESLIERSLPEGKIVFDTKEIEHDRMILTITVSWCNGKGKPRREVAMFRFLTSE